MLELIARLGSEPPTAWPMVGRETDALWEIFIEVAAIDLVAVRTLEPHVDALTILGQQQAENDRATAGVVAGTWGVYAAESRNAQLNAVPDPDDTTLMRLDGTKPWCSLASRLDSALISAHTDAGRQLFAVNLRDPGVTVEPVTWASRGLTKVESGPVRFVNVPAQAVGDPGWYLERPGFAWGGAGVAACWFGGATGLYRDLVASAQRKGPDQLALAWLGRAGRLVRDGRAILREAAIRIDADNFEWTDSLALRGTIAELCDDMLAITMQALGPAELAFDEDHARRVADLAMYIQQHHGARDDAGIGRAILDEDWQPSAPTQTGAFLE